MPGNLAVESTVIAVVPVPKDPVLRCVTGILWLRNSTSLNGLLSLPSEEISGEPKVFSTERKLPALNVVGLFCTNSVSRALFNSTKVCPCVPISYPRTYALPGDNPIAIFVESPPSPVPSTPPTLVNTPSLRPSL